MTLKKLDLHSFMKSSKLCLPIFSTRAFPWGFYLSLLESFGGLRDLQNEIIESSDMVEKDKL